MSTNSALLSISSSNLSSRSLVSSVLLPSLICPTPIPFCGELLCVMRHALSRASSAATFFFGSYCGRASGRSANTPLGARAQPVTHQAKPRLAATSCGPSRRNGNRRSKLNRKALLPCQRSSWTADLYPRQKSGRISPEAPFAVESNPSAFQPPPERVGPLFPRRPRAACHDLAAETPCRSESPPESSSSLCRRASALQSGFPGPPGYRTRAL